MGEHKYEVIKQIQGSMNCNAVPQPGVPFGGNTMNFTGLASLETAEGSCTLEIEWPR